MATTPAWRRFSVLNTGVLLHPSDEHHPLLDGEPDQLFVHDIVLTLALDENHPRNALGIGERRTAATNRSVSLASGAVEAIGDPSWRCTYPISPAAYCNFG